MGETIFFKVFWVCLIIYVMVCVFGYFTVGQEKYQKIFKTLEKILIPIGMLFFLIDLSKGILY